MSNRNDENANIINIKRDRSDRKLKAKSVKVTMDNVNMDIKEESLIPSDLFHETEESHQKSHSPAHCFMTTFINPTHYFLFFEAPVGLLINQLKNHQGSIYLQYTLSFLPEKDINNLFLRLLPHLVELMCSHYGNYFMQKFFLKLEINQRLMIFSLLQFNFIQICGDKCGTYSIQGLIEAIKTQKEEAILQNLISKHLLFLFCNENAQHVMQKIIINFPEHKREYINEFLLENVKEICTNQNGVLCVKKFIIMNSNLNLRVRLVKCLEENIYTLLKNESGCCILLFFMEKYGISYSSFIVTEIKKKIFSYFTQEPFVIGLIEKVIRMIEKFDNREYINLTWQIIKNDKILNSMFNNENGLRILLAFLENCTNEQKNYFRSKRLSCLVNNKISFDKISKLII